MLSSKWIAAPAAAFALCAFFDTASAGDPVPFTGCPGASGITPTLATSPGVAVAGQPFDIVITGPPMAMGRMMIGSPSSTMWNGMLLPLDLTSLGIPGCVLEVPSNERQHFILDEAGDFSFTKITIPVVGMTGCVQVFVRDEDKTTFGGMSDSLCITTVVPPVAEAGDVIVTEFMQNPNFVSDADGEWFEVFNTTKSTIDMVGWVISDDGGESHTIGNTGSLPGPPGGGGASFEIGPGERRVLGINGDMMANGCVGVDYVYTGFTLDDDADEIILTDAVGQVQDRVSYGVSFSLQAGRSTSFLPNVSQDATANNDGNNWCSSFTGLINCVGLPVDPPPGTMTGDTATPGDPNDDCGD